MISRRKIYTLSKYCNEGHHTFTEEGSSLFCSTCHPLAGYRYESNNRPSINITFTSYLILFNFFVYVIFIINFNIDYDIFEINPIGYNYWSANTNRIFAGEIYRIITAIFIHLNIFHLVFNMFALLFIGYKAENIYGKKYALIIYLLSGMSGNIASLLAGPFQNSLGSSGAIIGLYGASVVKQNYGIIRKAIFLFIFLYIVSLGSGVNLYSHVFGITTGILLAKLFTSNYHNFAFYYQERGI